MRPESEDSQAHLIRWLLLAGTELGANILLPAPKFKPPEHRRLWKACARWHRWPRPVVVD
jgi:hypothetical protein